MKIEEIVVSRILTIIILSSLLFVSALSKADFASAMANYEKQKFPEALEEFKRLGAIGHKDSQFNIGVMYYRGEGVEKDPVEGYAWMAVAATDGNAEHAHLRDSVIKKLNANERAKSLARADELLSKFGEEALRATLTPVLLPDSACQYSSTPLHIEKPAYPAELMRENISGVVDVEFTIDKYSFVRDYSVLASNDRRFGDAVLVAMKKWRYKPLEINGQAVEVASAQVKYKFLINESPWDKTKIKKYVAELRAKAEKGDAVTLYQSAYTADLMKELRIEKQESNAWYFKSAQAGLPDAQYQIGKSLINGEGCQADIQKGTEWLLLAAQANSPDAQYFLGVSLLNSNKFQQNKKQAIDWLNNAAISNHPKAAMRLAWILATDKDEHIRDPKKALGLLTSVYEFYKDRLRADETLAAVQAANGLFEDAAKSQERALVSAKEINYPLEAEQQRLDSYKKHEMWVE